jgi:D-glycero-alpha-D-manno-heptose-7-phosphate kinase
MIITSTPLRISFFGGGSDIPQYYNKKPGMVISTSIDRQIQIAVNRCETSHIRAVYSEMEVVDNVENIKHSRIREALKYFAISNNIEICSFSDVSTKGTGLGSSSTFTVGLLNALYNQKNHYYNRKDLAETACEIEIDKLKEPIGKQDQYAAAYGGFNIIRFDSSNVEITPINVGANVLRKLNHNLMFYFTGISRNTSDILSDQVSNITDNQTTFDNTTRLVDLAEDALKFLQQNKLNDFGSLLGVGWDIKKKLSTKISNPEIDEMYETAISAGALGGKLLGAGGGGYLMFYVPELYQNKVTLSMSKYKKVNFNFTDKGSSACQL